VNVSKPDAEILEKEWDATLFNSKRGLAPATGWKLLYHTLRSKGSRSGFPDRVLVRDRVIFAELKREKTKPTDEQKAWLDGLARAGAETYLWIPSDLNEIGRILGPRWAFISYPATDLPHLASLEGPWRPASLWLPGVGRADANPTLL
jgi:hypothetical protein